MRLKLALAAVVLSGGLASAADVVFPRGGSVGLVPPVGMVESASFSGFEDPAKGAAILLVEMPPQAYDQVAAGFTDAALATKGITVDSRTTLPLGDTKTLLMTGKQQAGTVTARKWILLAGTATATALVTVQEPADGALDLSGEEVRKTLLTLTFRAPPSPQEQMSNLPFKLDNLSGFRVVKVIGNTAAILTDGPKDVIEGAEQAVFVAGVAPGTPREDDRRQFALRALSSVPGVKDMRIERAEPLRMGGQAGFEILAAGKDVTGNADVKVVQWLRFGQSAHLRMVGIVKAADFPGVYPRLRAIRDGVSTN
ncbi:hypothetical protein ABLE91_08195 [Aquabacter sp. CN5-332]|uniref:hypothetical protein n=1 Tax=Aquabacter sp. CN5-332 TaxID=3156608 RepID=UPI0032B5934F